MNIGADKYPTGAELPGSLSFMLVLTVYELAVGLTPAAEEALFKAFGASHSRVRRTKPQVGRGR